MDIDLARILERKWPEASRSGVDIKRSLGKFKSTKWMSISGTLSYCQGSLKQDILSATVEYISVIENEGHYFQLIFEEIIILQGFVGVYSDP